MADLASEATDQPSLAQMRREIRALKSLVRFLRSSLDLVGRASVETGKELTIRGVLKLIGSLDLTGTASMKDAVGNELFRMGDMPIGRGIAMLRENGSTALAVRKPFSVGDQQQWVLYDLNGATVMAEDPLFGGLSQPFLEHNFQPIAASSGTAVVCGPYGFERTTSSGSFETLFVHDGKRQNGLLDLKIAAVCSNGTTAAEIQVVDLATGTPLPGFLIPPWLGAIPTGTTTLTVFDPTPDQVVLSGFAVGAQMRLGIQVRRTAGAGSITVAVPQSIGG